MIGTDRAVGAVFCGLACALGAFAAAGCDGFDRPAEGGTPEAATGGRSAPGGDSGGGQACCSAVRLDQFEVTVARFRKFVGAIDAGSGDPRSVSGKHVHLNGGRGVANASPGGRVPFEDGWQLEWDQYLPQTLDEWEKHFHDFALETD
jgi:hypothetical protein